MEFKCPHCGKETWLKKTPVFEGFKKTGEKQVCAACGGDVGVEEALAAATTRKPVIFTEADRSAIPQVFDESDKGRLCRHCRHYVVNPFRQWCGLHRREVEATDTCDRFVPPPELPAKPLI
jgi:hypothetical protein